MVQRKSVIMVKIHLKKWTVLTLMALTILLVKVIMLDLSAMQGRECELEQN